MKRRNNTAVVHDFPGNAAGSSTTIPKASPGRSWFPDPEKIFLCLLGIPLSGLVAILALVLSGPRGWWLLCFATVLGIIIGLVLGTWFWLAVFALPAAAGWSAALASRH
jgi:hypothetical protein